MICIDKIINNCALFIETSFETKKWSGFYGKCAIFIRYNKSEKGILTIQKRYNKFKFGFELKKNLEIFTS